MTAKPIARYAKIIGHENLIARGKCALSSRATDNPEVDPKVVWVKFAALAESVRVATGRLRR